MRNYSFLLQLNYNEFKLKILYIGGVIKRMCVQF
jgi:hypothetical protein